MDHASNCDPPTPTCCSPRRISIPQRHCSVTKLSRHAPATWQRPNSISSALGFRSVCVSPTLASHANADVLIGTLKSPPARANKKSLPPGVSPNVPPSPVRSTQATRAFRPCAIRPRLAQPENLKRRPQMTDSNETKTVTSRTPSHFACNVRNREGGDNYWLRIGSAWAHADGNGFNRHVAA